MKTPQKYWTRPIIFKDTPTEPPENTSVDIEGKRYAAFSTREIGVCYASADLLPAMRDLNITREYLFAGTIFLYHGRYVPVVQSYTPVMDIQALSKDMKTMTEKKHDNFAGQTLRPMADLLAAVQSAQLSYAKKKNIPLNQLYDPTSEHFVIAMDIARAAIYHSEQKNNTSAAEILARYLSIVLAKQCASEAASQTVAGTESTTPSATNTVPKKPSWSERRTKAREKKESERKTKDEAAPTTNAAPSAKSPPTDQ